MNDNEVNLKDVFNIGWILLLSGMVAPVILASMPSDFRPLGVSSQLAGIGIIIYTSIKFYEAGREGR
jgi:hypothetical protein